MGFWDGMAKGRLLVDASVWSADFTRLGDEIARADDHVDLYHFDVADAHFVPGLLLFPDLVASLRPLTRRPFNVHLMTDSPLPLIREFADAGANMITVHCETADQVPSALREMEERGLARGLALGLTAPLALLDPYLDVVDMVLLMGTPLGVKAQPLSPDALLRIERLRAVLRDRGLEHKVRIEADGGIRDTTVPGLRRAGADIVVPGSLAFRSKDLPQTLAWIRSLP